MGDAVTNIVVQATDKSKSVLDGVSRNFDHITASAKKANEATAALGSRLGASRFDAQWTNLGRSMSAFDTRWAASTRNIGIGMSQIGAQAEGLGGVLGNLGGMGALLGGAGIGAAVVGVGKLALDLGNLGEQAEKAEKRFIAFSGGTLEATQNLDAMRAATEGSMSDMESMANASRILSMGLADTGKGAAEIVRMAAMLDTLGRSATDASEDFGMLLANQSMRRLDQFGISADQVRRRIDALKAANASLSNEQAFTNAVLEIGRERMAQLEAQGVTVGTSADKLRSAWHDLRVEMGKPIVGVVKVVQEGAAAGMRGAADIMRGENAAAEMADIKLAATKDRLIMAYQQQRNVANASEDAVKAAAAAEVQAAEKAYALALAYRLMATSSSDATSEENRFAEGASRVATEAAKAATEVSKLTTEMIIAMNMEAGKTGAMYGNWAVFAHDVGTNPAGRSGRDTSGYNAFVGGVAATSGNEDVRAAAVKKQLDDQVAGWEKIRAASTKAANEAQSEWEKAYNALKSEATSYADAARQASIALTPGGKAGESDWLQPGANGPFENLFRAKDVAVHGDASKWAKALGMDQETAKKITQEFEAGILSADVQALIDKQAIVDRVRLRTIAEQTEAAFAEEIAKAAGADTRSVDEILGFTDARISTAGSNIGTKVKGALDAQKTTLTTAGAGMSGDVLTGLDSKTSEFQTLGWNQADAYLKGYQARLDARSPSREMMKLGRSALEGFNIGASGAYGFGPVISGRSGGSRGGGAATVYNSSRRYYQGDTITINVQSDAALGAVLAAQRASKQKRLGTG